MTIKKQATFLSQFLGNKIDGIKLINTGNELLGKLSNGRVLTIRFAYHIVADFSAGILITITDKNKGKIAAHTVNYRDFTFVTGSGVRDNVRHHGEIEWEACVPTDKALHNIKETVDAIVDLYI